MSATQKTGPKILLNSKQKLLVELIKSSLATAPEEKSLVFSNFLESLTGVANALKQKKEKSKTQLKQQYQIVLL